jgi:hypothetical protein
VELAVVSDIDTLKDPVKVVPLVGLMVGVATVVTAGWIW